MNAAAHVLSISSEPLGTVGNHLCQAWASICQERQTWLILFLASFSELTAVLLSTERLQLPAALLTHEVLLAQRYWAFHGIGKVFLPAGQHNKSTIQCAADPVRQALLHAQRKATSWDRSGG